jgi:DNA-3-methyladenine glycosylase
MIDLSYKPAPAPARKGLARLWRVKVRSKKLPRSFYLQPTLTIAKELLGKYLIRKIRNQTLIGKIVEVEAYLGENYPASHAFNGRTRRNDVMFWRGGHLYVYFTYGMHFCANIVTEEEGKGRAVLLRAVEPIEGIEIMKRLRKMNRKKGASASEVNATNGPAKFCEAFDIKREQNGTDLLGKEIYITQGENIPRSKIISSKRIGITNGSEKKWRFYIKENPFVSKK